MKNRLHPHLVGNDNDGKPRLLYAWRLWMMTDDALLHETEQKIWLSAYAANNRRSDYHWQVDVCYDECVRKGKPEMYDKALKQAKRSCGY